MDIQHQENSRSQAARGARQFAAWPTRFLVALLLAPALVAPGQIRINEFLAINTSANADPQGEYDDWIELYNAGAAAVDIGGMYVTDDLQRPTKCRIPTGFSAQTTIAAGGRLLLWADNEPADGPLHVGFQLNGAGEQIGLYASDGLTPIDTLTFAQQVQNVSFGRFPDGDLLEWRFFSPPSPGAPNTGGYQGRVAGPTFSVSRGIYSAPFQVAISTATPSAQIYYTLDGSEPTQSSTLYSGPISITGTKIVRARAYRTNWLASDIVTHTYMFLASTISQSNAGAIAAGCPVNLCPSVSVSMTIPGDYEVDLDVVTNPAYTPYLTSALTQIPSLSLSMPVDNWFGYSTGLISNSPLADNLGWERACSAELIHPDGRKGFAVNCGISLIGGTSPDISSSFGFKSPKHSFRLLFKDVFGPTRLVTDSLIFPGSRQKSFNTLVLDARLNMTWYHPWDQYQREHAEYLRDQYMCDMQSKLGDLSEGGFYAHVYLNGLYWGMYCVHERPDENFQADYRGGEPEDYDVLKHNSSTVIAGSNTGYLAMFTLARSGLTNQTNYESLIAQYLDLDPFINYMLLNFWAGNTDWAHQNWYCGRNRVETGGLFCYYSWDAEHTLKGEMDSNVARYDSGGPTELHQLLKQNTEYKIRFADRAHKLLKNGGLFTAAPATAMYNIRVNEISDAIIMESARWGDYRRDVMGQAGQLYYLYTRDGWWIPEINRLRNVYFPGRANTVLGQLRSNGVFPTIEAPVFYINAGYQHGGTIAGGAALTMTNPNGSGTIYYTLDGSDPRQAVTGAVSPTARNYGTTPPAPLTDTTWARARVLDGATWSALNDAVYRLNIADYTALLITEVMYNPAPPGGATSWGNDDFEFIEIKNTGSHTLDLSGVRLDDGVFFTFHDSTIGDAQLLAPGHHVVVVENEKAFRSRYGSGVYLAGQYWGSLDNAGERIRLIGPTSNTLVEFEYGDGREWPQAADGSGHSLVPLGSALAAQPAGSGYYGGNWRASTYIYGSPGADDPAAPTSGPIGVVLNEIAANTVHAPSPPDSNDWIELFNPTAGDIVLNNCYLSDDIQNPAKWQIPNGALIRAGGFLTFDEITHFHNPVGFGLDQNGERAVLSYLPAVGQTRILDEGRFKAQEDGVTLGRYRDGATASGPAVASWRAMTPTRNAANRAPAAEPVINQIMYHPNDHTTGSEYLELRNPTTQTVQLWNAVGRWRVSGGVDYQFPTTTTLPASGYFLLLPFNPANATALNAFKAKYGVSSITAQMFGPYTGNLSDRGERVALERPQASGLPDDPVAWAIVDETFYFHQAPFPTGAAGGGQALHRVSAAAPGADPTNWAGAAPILQRTGVVGPLVANRPAGGITSGTATLNGEVTSTGGENPTVRIYWGTSDGGTNPAGWQHVQNLGTRPLGTFFAAVSSLIPATTYYFRCYAQNSAASMWATTTARFTTNNAPLAAPTVALRTPASITQNSVTLNGEVLNTGGENPTVRFYWGATDGGKNTAAWQNYRTLGVLGAGLFSANVTGLSPSTHYYYQAYAANSAGPAWAAASGTFDTLAGSVVPPAIATLAPTNVTHNSATLNGQVTSTGGQNPTVYVYWGTVAGGQTPGNWQYSQNLGARGVGLVAANVTSLIPATTYYYRFYAGNSAGGTWAAGTGSFTTSNPPITLPMVTIAAAMAVDDNWAMVGGAILATGGENPSVRIYWGTADGGQVAANWQHVEQLGQRGAGEFFATVVGLSPRTKYYYRVFAQNSAGGVWTGALNFTTAPTLPATAGAQLWQLFR